jgi:hypothetical protein
MFLAGLSADGITNSIISAIVVAPDSLIAATTPVIANFGNALWTNHNFVSGDLSVNGLQGDGSTKFLETGVKPVTAGLVTTEGALSFYAYDKNTTVFGAEIGYGGSGAADWFLLSNLNGAGFGTIYDCYNNGSGRVGLATTPGNGFYIGSRTAANAESVYFANSGTPFAAIGSATGSGATIADNFIFVFKSDTATQISNARLSFVAISHGLGSVGAQALYNRVQTLRVAFGGGYR